MALCTYRRKSSDSAECSRGQARARSQSSWQVQIMYEPFLAITDNSATCCWVVLYSVLFDFYPPDSYHPDSMSVVCAAKLPRSYAVLLYGTFVPSFTRLSNQMLQFGTFSRRSSTLLASRLQGSSVLINVLSHCRRSRKGFRARLVDTSHYRPILDWATFRVPRSRRRLDGAHHDLPVRGPPVDVHITSGRILHIMCFHVHGGFA